MFCGKCGTEVGELSQFCPSCGMQVEAQDEETVGTSPPTSESESPEPTQPSPSQDQEQQYQPTQSPPAQTPPVQQPPPGQQEYRQAAPRSDDLIYPPVNPMDPVLMGFVGFCCFSGIAQIILGQTVKGIVMLVLMLLIVVPTAGIGLVMNILVGIDAYLIAKKLKEGTPVGKWEFF